MQKLSTNEEEAKVFRAHAVPQGLCENLIKLLANQERDGDSPTQSIVTGLREKSKGRIVNWLRSLIDLDNHCAVDVGHLRTGLRTFKVMRPKMSGDHSEVVREGADDLTQRAEEVDTQNACINVDHIDENLGD